MAKTRQLQDIDNKFKYLKTIDLSYPLKLAIFYGQLEVIKLHKDIISRNKSTIVCELTHLGHLDILQYFINHLSVIPSERLLHIASTAGHLLIVKWLHEERKINLTVPLQDKDKHTNYLVWILRKGHLHIAEWLTGKPSGTSVLAEAKRTTHLKKNNPSH